MQSMLIFDHSDWLLYLNFNQSQIFRKTVASICEEILFLGLVIKNHGSTTVNKDDNKSNNKYDLTHCICLFSCITIIDRFGENYRWMNERLLKHF